jgi:putative OPT family oligopeptide transporter
MSHASTSPEPPGSGLVKPYIPADESPPELTPSALAVGAALGIVYAASSVYLGLKVGMTVSASIPIAVLSVAIFRKLFRRIGSSPILVNNIVQTTGSAGESIAAGVAFTLPALLLLGFELGIWRILLVALLGGVLGVLMMVPLRHALIVKEHGRLTYPEGTACAQVLIAGEKGGGNAKSVFGGFFVGLVYSFLSKVLRLWEEFPGFAVAKDSRHFAKASVAGEMSAALIGVGYVIGYETAAVMMAGGVLAFLVLVPFVQHFGAAVPGVLGAGVEKTISEMSAGEIHSAYVLYVGAGAVATGGFISLAKALPTIGRAFVRGLGGVGGARRVEEVPRTQRDLSMRVVLFGSLALVIAIAAAPVLDVDVVSSILIVFFGFFFVTVSSRLTGEIGSSSNPISGMTVATLLLTCLIFVAVGRTGVDYKAMALTTAALVCVAASNGGTISQDLKTGFLVGATPQKQQKAILVGVLTSSFVIGWTLLALNNAAETHAPVQKTYAEVAVSPALLADAPREEYEGRSYRVMFVNRTAADSRTAAAPAGPAQPPIPRGKYLVDDAGRIAFFVDPGVCGTMIYRVSPPPADAPNYATLPSKDEKSESYVVDAATYRVVEDAARGGTWLVDDAGGRVAYAATKVQKYNAPKARLFQLIIDGVLGGELPWTLVLVGVFIALTLELIGVDALTFAVGLYLPIDASVPLFVGGIVRKLADRRSGVAGLEAESSPGMLLASGLIAGGSIGALVAVFMQGGAPGAWDSLNAIGNGLFVDAEGHAPLQNPVASLVPPLLLCVFLYRVAAGRGARRAV